MPQNTITKSEVHPTNHSLKVADAVWIATAYLHRKYAERHHFSTEDIVAAVQSLHLTNATYRSIWQHVNQHCVANREPKPNRSRMLRAWGKGERSLFRTGDPFVEAREGSPTHPDWSELPDEFKYLQQWYEDEWDKAAKQNRDPLLALSGTWNFGDANTYLRELREGWE